MLEKTYRMLANPDFFADEEQVEKAKLQRELIEARKKDKGDRRTIIQERQKTRAQILNTPLLTPKINTESKVEEESQNIEKMTSIEKRMSQLKRVL